MGLLREELEEILYPSGMVSSDAIDVIVQMWLAVREALYQHERRLINEPKEAETQ